MILTEGLSVWLTVMLVSTTPIYFLVVYHPSAAEIMWSELRGILVFNDSKC